MSNSRSSKIREKRIKMAKDFDKEGYSRKDISEIMGVKESTIREYLKTPSRKHIVYGPEERKLLAYLFLLIIATIIFFGGLNIINSSVETRKEINLPSTTYDFGIISHGNVTFWQFHLFYDYFKQDGVLSLHLRKMNVNDIIFRLPANVTGEFRFYNDTYTFEENLDYNKSNPAYSGATVYEIKELPIGEYIFLEMSLSGELYPNGVYNLFMLTDDKAYWGKFSDIPLYMGEDTWKEVAQLKLGDFYCEGTCISKTRDSYHFTQKDESGEVVRVFSEVPYNEYHESIQFLINTYDSNKERSARVDEAFGVSITVAGLILIITAFFEVLKVCLLSNRWYYNRVVAPIFLVLLFLLVLQGLGFVKIF